MTVPNTSLDAECTAEQLLPALWERLQPLLQLSWRMPGTAPEDGSLTKRTYGHLAEEARSLEIFLDDHGAWSNCTFVSLIEYVASLRGFAIIGFTLHHIQDRLGRQYPEGEGEFREKFRSATKETREFTDTVIGNLLREIQVVVSEHYSGDLLEAPPSPTDPVNVPIRQRLPADLEQFDPSDHGQHVVEIASRFLAHKKILEELGATQFENVEDMRRQVKETSDEDECRFFETRIQNLLARYDTCIKGSLIEKQDEDLPVIRGHVAVVRRIARVVTEYIHFFERHQTEREGVSAPTRVLELVDLDKVLHCALNYGLHYVHAYMEEATPFINRVVERYTRRESLTLQIPEDVNLHIRPVSLIAKIVDHHKTPVNITIGDSTCFAGSIVQVLMALGACPAAKEVSFEGDQSALEDLKLLFEHRLGESGQGALPEKLSYLGL